MSSPTCSAPRWRSSAPPSSSVLHGRAETFRVTIGPIDDVAQADRRAGPGRSPRGSPTRRSWCDRGGRKDADPTPGVARIGGLWPAAGPGRSPARTGAAPRRPPRHAGTRPRRRRCPDRHPGQHADRPGRYRRALGGDHRLTTPARRCWTRTPTCEMPPSSMTKLMTIYIVYRALAAGPHEARPGICRSASGPGGWAARRCSCRSAPR